MTGINTSATMYCPLSPEEVKLAKAFKIHQKMEAGLRPLIESKINGHGCEVELAEAREKRHEARELRRENAHLFTADFWYALNGFTRVCFDSWAAESRARSGIGFGHMHLPEGNFSVDALRNAITIGMGSRIPLGRYTLHVFDNMVSAFPNNINNPKQGFNNAADIFSSNAQSLNWLIHAMGNGNMSLSGDSAFNGNTLRLLQQMGIDTSRDFTINGVAFEVNNGTVQTKGFTPHTNPNRTFIGVEGLNNLVKRAYAQNLFNPATD